MPDALKIAEEAKPDPYEGLPDPIGYRYWSVGHSSRWVFSLPGKQPPDAEPMFSAAQVRALLAERDALAVDAEKWRAVARDLSASLLMRLGNGKNLAKAMAGAEGADRIVREVCEIHEADREAMKHLTSYERAAIDRARAGSGEEKP